MNIISDPRIAPAWTAALAAVALGVGVIMSAQRLRTFSFEQGNDSIAQSRVSSCRVLGGNETVRLGGYYFQPTDQGDGRMTGDLLQEGVYICDLYGTSARIERGGYAQYLVTGDVSSMNKTLMERLKDPTNPDSNEASRPRLDASRPIYQAPPPEPQPDTLFQLKQ